jgi:phage gp36-like protein
MAYAAASDFVEVLGEGDLIKLTNPGNPAATTVNLDRLEGEVQRQSDVMDSYFGRQNTLPLPSIPRPAVTCCVWLTIHALDNKRTREGVRQRYEDWIKWLEQVSKGTATLGIRQDDPAPVRVGEPVAFAGSDSFGNINLSDF